MKGIGVDIVDLDRIDIENDHFVRRILTETEYQIFISLPVVKRKREFLGGRFAAKEAYVKACHVGIGEIGFQDIEVLNDKTGCPYFVNTHAHISISHEEKYAIAFVMIEE